MSRPFSSRLRIPALPEEMKVFLFVGVFIWAIVFLYGIAADHFPEHLDGQTRATVEYESISSMSQAQLAALPLDELAQKEGSVKALLGSDYIPDVLIERQLDRIDAAALAAETK